MAQTQECKTPIFQSRSLSIGNLSIEKDEKKAYHMSPNEVKRNLSPLSLTSPPASILSGTLVGEKGVDTSSLKKQSLKVNKLYKRRQRSKSPFKRRSNSLTNLSQENEARQSRSTLVIMTKSSSHRSNSFQKYERNSTSKRIPRNYSLGDLTAETDEISVSTSGTNRDSSINRDTTLTGHPPECKNVTSKFLPVLNEAFNIVLDDALEEGTEAELVSSRQMKSDAMISSNISSRKSEMSKPDPPLSKRKKNRSERLKELKSKKQNNERHATPPALRSRLSTKEVAKVIKISKRSSAAAVKQLNDERHGLIDPPKGSLATTFFSYAYNKIIVDPYAIKVNEGLRKFSKRIGFRS